MNPDFKPAIRAALQRGCPVDFLAPHAAADGGAALRRVRSQFTLCGTSLNRWAKEHGYPVMTAYLAAKSARSGPVAVKVRGEMEAWLAKHLPASTLNQEAAR